MDLIEWSMTPKRPLDVRDLYRLRLLSDPQVSPDGTRIAFVLKQLDEETNEYRSNLFEVRQGGGIVQLTRGNKDWGPRWSPDGRYLAFVSGRKDGAQIHLLSLCGGESETITDLPLGAGLPSWAPDGSAIAFTGVVSIDADGTTQQEEGDRQKVAPTRVVDRAMYKLDGAGYIGNRRRHLFVIDMATRSILQITEGDHHNDNPRWSPDCSTLTFSSNRSPHWDLSLESDIYLTSRGGGEARKITSGATFGRPVVSPRGDRIAVFGHRNPENLFAPGRLYSMNLEGEDLRDELGDWDGNVSNGVVSDVVLSAEEHGVPLRWDEDGLYFLGTVRGECNLYCARDGVHAVTQGHHTITDFSRTQDGLIVYACADSTHLVELFRQAGGQTEQLTRENDALLDEVAIARPERLSYAGSDGEVSEGWLLPPAGHESGTHPLIVYIHGGPMLAHGEAFHFEYQLLAGAGFGIFSPNIHGSSSYGRAYQTSIAGNWGNRDHVDVLAGTAEAASRPWVDGQRIGIAGGSYGGYMTNWAVTHGGPWRAAVTERCLCNMVSFYGTADNGWIWNRQFGPYPEQDVAKLWDMSPIQYVERVSIPVLVIHSTNDDRTPIEQGEQMFNALRRLGKETRLVVFPDESHGLSRIGKPSRRIERLEHILGWFRTHL